MPRGKYLRVVALCITVADVLLLIVLALAGMTVAGSVMASLSPPAGGQPPLGSEVRPNGEIVFGLQATNGGLLSSRMTLAVDVVAEGNVVAQGEQSAVVPPRSQSPLSVVLQPSKAARQVLARTRPTVRLRFEVRTLGDRVGMSMAFEMEGLR